MSTRRCIVGTAFALVDVPVAADDGDDVVSLLVGGVVVIVVELFPFVRSRAVTSLVGSVVVVVVSALSVLPRSPFGPSCFPSDWFRGFVGVVVPAAVVEADSAV